MDLVFFFSSRRRHTRLQGDWSSDVCSSDLVTNWFGFAFPKGTPKEAVDTLREDVVRALAAPDVREKLASQGAEPSSFTPAEFARFLKEDTRRWTELIRASRIKVEP